MADIVGFLVVALWALPMLLSMGTDNDHPLTLGGTMFSNAAVAGEIWAMSKLPAGWPASGWWLIPIGLILVVTYFGIWCVFSEKFSGLVGSIFRKKAVKAVKDGRPKKHR